MTIRELSTALLFCVLLAACGNATEALTARVPTTGPIKQGELVGERSVDQFIRVIARPPSRDMTALEVVQGFLDASASFDGDHAVAREYLTPEANERWDPSVGVLVHEGIPVLSEAGPNVTVVATRVGRVESGGHYVVSNPGSEITAFYTLVDTPSGLRIESLPNGLLLSRADVDRAFRSYSLYFFNPSFERLVPDARMIPVIGPGLATTLVRRLLDGPNDWLRPAVRTAFPEGVGLNIDAVPIEEGVAYVDLDASAQIADDASRRALSQQLVWTLKQLPEVTAVSISAGSQPLFVPGVGNPQPRDSWNEVDPAAMDPDSLAFVASVIGVRRITDAGTDPAPGQAGTDDPLLITIAVSADSSRIAGLDELGRLWVGRLAAGAQLNVVPPVSKPVSLAFDGNSVLWVVEESGLLVAIPPSGRPEVIEVSGFNGAETLSLAVPSRDGTRVAMLVDNGPRTTLLLGRVIRPVGAGASSVIVEEPIRVESKLVEVLDVAWSGADTVTVLGSETAGSVQVEIVDLGRGSMISRGAPEGPVSLAAAPGFPTLVAGSDGVVFENSSGMWDVKVNARSPAYPG